MAKKIIAITLGDPGGIGPEVTVKALARLQKTPRFRGAHFLLIGSLPVYEYWARRIAADFSWRVLPYFQKDFFQPGKLHVLDLPNARLEHSRGKRVLLPESFAKGKADKRNALWAYTALREAAALAGQKKIQGIVTAPLNKSVIQLIDKEFTGHTEFLARQAKVKQFAMFFDAGKLRVGLATIHVPLRQVSAELSISGIKDKLRLAHAFLSKYYGIARPRIAVSALNPHGREFGWEEDGIILPAIRAARKLGINASGPCPGDTVFHEAFSGSYDFVLAMYHDQGLAPLKLLAFDRAVNITAGLPYIRTSPDHGTAFDIAYQNKAREDSMLAAIEKILVL